MQGSDPASGAKVFESQRVDMCGSKGNQQPQHWKYLIYDKFDFGQKLLQTQAVNWDRAESRRRLDFS